jgi:murein hydrolase activator
MPLRVWIPWLLLLSGLLLAGPRGAYAQAMPEAPSGEVSTGDASAKEQLRGIETQIDKSTFEQRRLTYEIDNISAEAQALRTSLIETVRKVREAEERFAAQEGKAETVSRQEEALRRSLQSRERVTGEVLAAMQRIGRKPPPALLVAPEDVLSAMRAAIMLGGVLPDMRDEAMVLVADLKTLVELRRQSVQVAEQLRRERDILGAERRALDDLVATRQSQISLSREQLDLEKARVATLTREARSLRDLLARSDTEIIGNSRAVEIARRAPAPAKGTIIASLRPETLNREAARLQPRQAFVERRGQLPLPVSGSISRPFGAADGLGGTERGITISSNPNAVVAAPADGWVHFAGPFRGYGHLLIINSGGGYHLVLAGMERLSVEIGQFVLAGEPIGFLGGEAGQAARTGQASAPGNLSQSIHFSQSTLGALRPALYVEFRKDGSPVDPSPWWSNQSAEKARG